MPRRLGLCLLLGNQCDHPLPTEGALLPSQWMPCQEPMLANCCLSAQCVRKIKKPNILDYPYFFLFLFFVFKA